MGATHCSCVGEGGESTCMWGVSNTGQGLHKVEGHRHVWGQVRAPRKGKEG